MGAGEVGDDRGEESEDRLERLHLFLMLALTFSTGVIDAVGYLGLDRVFTANMTGNVVILAMGLAGADGLPIVGPLIALLAFMVGAALGGRILRPVPTGWTRRTTSLLLVVGILISTIAIPALVIPGTLPEPLIYSTTGILGCAMGMQAAAARHIAVKEVSTVVITGTMVGLAADSWLGRKVPQLWYRRAIAIVLIGMGAAVGALALNIHLGVGIAIAAGITMVVAIIGQVKTPRSDNNQTGERPGGLGDGPDRGDMVGTVAGKER